MEATEPRVPNSYVESVTGIWRQQCIGIWYIGNCALESVPKNLIHWQLRNDKTNYIYIFLFGYYPFTAGATTILVTVVASLKLCTMQYKNLIDTLISTIIVNKSYCPLY